MSLTNHVLELLQPSHSQLNPQFSVCTYGYQHTQSWSQAPLYTYFNSHRLFAPILGSATFLLGLSYTTKPASELNTSPQTLCE